MKCLNCNLVNPFNTTVCKRCQFPLESSSFTQNPQHIWRDGKYLVVYEQTTSLPPRCFKCNSRKIVSYKTQSLEYVPLSSQLTEFVIGSLIPIPIPLPDSKKKRTLLLNLNGCRQHKVKHQLLSRISYGFMIVGLLCCIAGFILTDYPGFFEYLLISAVIIFGIGWTLYFATTQIDFVTQHKYKDSFFWVKGFGNEYLDSFTDLNNSNQR